MKRFEKNMLVRDGGFTLFNLVRWVLDPAGDKTIAPVPRGLVLLALTVSAWCVVFFVGWVLWHFLHG